MARKFDYEPIDFNMLEITARIMGSNSAAADALMDMDHRRQAGQVSVAVKARARGARESTLLVFDARQPPDFLPSAIRVAYVEAAKAADIQIGSQA